MFPWHKQLHLQSDLGNHWLSGKMLLMLIYYPWNIKGMTDFNTSSIKRGINIYQYKEFD